MSGRGERKGNFENGEFAIYIYISLFVAYLATDFCMERVRHFCTRMSPFYIHFICIITFLGTLLKYKYENAKKA